MEIEERKKNYDQDYQDSDETLVRVKNKFQKVVVNKKNYYEVDCIGKGATSDIFLVTNRTTKNFAMKKIRKIQRDIETLQKAYLQETNILKQFNSPYILKLYEHEEQKFEFILILEYCDQGTLTNYLKNNNGPLDENTAISIFKQILMGIQALREQNIVHRDLKPDNILINQNQIKLADLGFAKEAQDLKSYVGTPLYISPEIIKLEENAKYNSKYDIYSLGIMLYEMTQNKRPYEDIRIFYKSDQDILQFYNSIKFEQPISQDLQKLILKMIHVVPEKRISYEELFQNPIFQDQNKNKYEKNEFDLKYDSLEEQLKNTHIKDDESPLKHADLNRTMSDLNFLQNEYEGENKQKEVVKYIMKYFFNEFNIVNQTSLICYQIQQQLPKKTYVSKDKFMYMIFKKINYEYKHIYQKMKNFIFHEQIYEQYRQELENMQEKILEKLKKDNYYKNLIKHLESLLSSIEAELVVCQLDINEKYDSEKTKMTLQNELEDYNNYTQNSEKVYYNVLKQYRVDYINEFEKYQNQYCQEDKIKAQKHLYTVTQNVIIGLVYKQNTLYDFSKITQQQNSLNYQQRQHEIERMSQLIKK